MTEWILPKEMIPYMPGFMWSGVIWNHILVWVPDILSLALNMSTLNMTKNYNIFSLLHSKHNSWYRFIILIHFTQLCTSYPLEVLQGIFLVSWLGGHLGFLGKVPKILNFAVLAHSDTTILHKFVMHHYQMTECILPKKMVPYMPGFMWSGVI